MTEKAYPNLDVAAAIAAGDGFVGRKAGETEDRSFADSVVAAWILANVITTAAQQSVHASGTVASLPNATAILNFGTQDPTLTLGGTGTYRITARAVLDYNGATFAASRTATLKLRRTNNTAADLTNGSKAVKTSITTTETSTLCEICIEVIYTTSGAGDVIELWGLVDTLPSAGSLDISSASIIAERLQQ